MAMDVPVIREVVERLCTRNDVLDACKHRDLGAVITVLGTHGVTQGQLSVLTGIPQGRLSEYKNRKRKPTAAAAGELERALPTAEEPLALAQGLGSRRVAGQVDLLYRRLGTWGRDPAVADLRGRLMALVDSFCRDEKRADEPPTAHRYDLG